MNEKIDELTMTRLELCDERIARIEAQKQIAIEQKNAVLREAMAKYQIGEQDKIAMDGTIMRAKKEDGEVTKP